MLIAVYSAARPHLKQLLQLFGLLVPQVEEAVARMVCVQTQPRAQLRLATLAAHAERLAAPRTELVLALAASDIMDIYVFPTTNSTISDSV